MREKSADTEVGSDGSDKITTNSSVDGTRASFGTKDNGKGGYARVTWDGREPRPTHA